MGSELREKSQLYGILEGKWKEKVYEKVINISVKTLKSFKMRTM